LKSTFSQGLLKKSSLCSNPEPQPQFETDAIDNIYLYNSTWKRSNTQRNPCKLLYA